MAGARRAARFGSGLCRFGVRLGRGRSQSQRLLCPDEQTRRRGWLRRKVPIPDIRALLNHLVGKGEEVVRDFQAEGFGGLQINYQLEFGWLQDGQLRRVRAV